MNIERRPFSDGTHQFVFSVHSDELRSLPPHRPPHHDVHDIQPDDRPSDVLLKLARVAMMIEAAHDAEVREKARRMKPRVPK